MADLTFRKDDLTCEASRALVRFHLADMIAQSPSYSMNAVDISALEQDDVTVISGWAGERIACIGALRILSADLGELKTMRTHADFLRQGVASALLERLLAEARDAGLARVAIETGTGGQFDAANRFYERHSFTDCAPFGGYTPTDFNRFMDRAV